jgi:hypothetical protein
LSPSASPGPSQSPSATGSNALSVSLVGAVDDSSYPDISLVLSIVDAANGRPLQALSPSNIALDPAAANLNATPSIVPLPAAYVLVLDTSGSMKDQTPDKHMTYMARATGLAKAFLAALGPEDRVNLITFSGTATSTGWRANGDGSLTDRIAAIKKPSGTTHLSAALVAAAAAASPAPAGIARRAVVLITDASSADKDPNLTPDQMRSKLGPPTFIVGLAPSDPGSPEDANLQNVAAVTGGSYLHADSATEPAVLFKPVLDSAHSTWMVRFRTDSTPDGKSHGETLNVAGAEGQTGSVAFSYRARGLSSVSSIAVDGLKDGDEVTADRTVRVSVVGTRSWAHTELDLYFDCDPAKCNPTLSASDGILTWPLAVAPLRQGSHRLVARLTVTDDKGSRFGPDEFSLSFVRSGTTWNIAAVALTGGIALVLIGAVFVASRRRGMRGGGRGAQ